MYEKSENMQQLYVVCTADSNGATLVLSRGLPVPLSCEHGFTFFYKGGCPFFCVRTA